MEQEFDIVIDALQTRVDALLKITNQNMEMGMFGIMDKIRLEQIEQLVRAMELWDKRNAN
jgi:hypothetical protein